MVKKIPLWLGTGLIFAFLAYVSTGLALLLFQYAMGGSISFQDLIDSLFFLLNPGAGIFLFIPLLCALIGGVIGFIFEKFFIITRKKK